jgi:polyprenyldihydroxybenzoate methyltransferase/3-demethylubiquinol 3-O-methyltransferase
MLRITAPVSRQLVRHLASKAAPVAAATNTVSAAEIAHFSSLSAHWWDPTGEFALLHRMNPARVKFMRETIEKDEELVGSRWLKGKSVLDVGCGGGIFAEVGHSLR